jgi:hypothetical protein
LIWENCCLVVVGTEDEKKLSAQIDPLLSCRIKVDRANLHFNELTEATRKFTARWTHQIYSDEESEPSIKIYRIRILEDIPAEWSGFIGDIIHNLRSALDCLAAELIIKFHPAAGEPELRDTYFPIAREPSDLNRGRRSRFLNRVGPRVERLVRRLQPYREGKGHVLWQIDALDIADKHRRIIPAFAGVGSINFFVVPPSNGSRLDLPKYQPPFPLKDGDEICRVGFFEPHFESNAHFRLEIAFNEDQIVVGEPVMLTLEKFIQYVDRVVEIFRQHCF